MVLIINILRAVNSTANHGCNAASSRRLCLQMVDSQLQQLRKLRCHGSERGRDERTSVAGRKRSFVL